MYNTVTNTSINSISNLQNYTFKSAAYLSKGVIYRYTSNKRKGVTPHERVIKVLIDSDGVVYYFSDTIFQKRIQCVECTLDENGNEKSRYHLLPDGSWNFVCKDVLIFSDKHGTYIKGNDWEFKHFTSHRDLQMGFERLISSGEMPVIPAEAFEYLDKATINAFHSKVKAAVNYVNNIKQRQRNMKLASYQSPSF